MGDRDLRLISDKFVRKYLDGNEAEVIAAVKRAYIAHGNGEVNLPFSTYLARPGNEHDHYLAFPAALGKRNPVIGIKWVSSYPGNLERNLPRATSLLVLNNTQTGVPKAIVEGSAISAARTGASAALAATYLVHEGKVSSCGLVGCGRINFEVLRYLHHQFAELESVFLFDLSHERAKDFQKSAEALWPTLFIRILDGAQAVARETELTSFATTALSPYLPDHFVVGRNSTILNISLSDFTGEFTLNCDNVVDDKGHVCREDTSIHLAEKLTSPKTNIRCTLGEIVAGRFKGRPALDRPVMFSPWGLGILDLAVGDHVLRKAESDGEGLLVKDFF